MAVNQQTLEGHWNDIKGRIQEKWGDITGDDLDRVKGKRDQVIGLIQRKTGKTHEEIEKQFDSISHDFASYWSQASDAIRNAAGQASEHAHSATEYVQHSLEGMTDEARKQVEAGYVQTKRVVANRPVESLAVCFGVGLVTGLVAGLVLRSK